MKVVYKTNLEVVEAPELGFHIIASVSTIRLKKDDSEYSLVIDEYKHFMFFTTKEKCARAREKILGYKQLTAMHIKESPRWFPIHKAINWSRVSNPQNKPIFVHAHYRAASGYSSTY